MTWPEMERAIAFLLESQATLSAKTDANAEAIAALTAKVDALAGVANTALDVSNRTAETVQALAAAQAKTSRQLRRLAKLIEAHASNGHGWHGSARGTP